MPPTCPAVLPLIARMALSLPHNSIVAPPLLRQIAETEIQSGSSGSGTIRDTALQALQQLLTAVVHPAQLQIATATEAHQAAADALAFFLPGIAVGLCKVLLSAGTSSSSVGRVGAPSRPAASSAAAVAAMQALVTLLVACLGDTVVQSALHGTGDSAVASSIDGRSWQHVDKPHAFPKSGNSSNELLQQAMQQLQMLSQQSKGISSSGFSSSRVSTGTGRAIPEPQQQQGRMRVNRNADWVHDSACRLHELLSTTLPPLRTHQRPTVREALAQGGWGAVWGGWRWWLGWSGLGVEAHRAPAGKECGAAAGWLQTS